MQRTISKVLSLILALTMIITLLPIGVLATAPPSATTTPTPVAENGTADAPYLITAPAQIYALARILTKAPTSDSISDELKADYKNYGIESAFAAGFAKLQTGHYKLQNAITLTNHSGAATNNFVGIPNFAGHFDGNNNTITLDIIFDYYPASYYIGGVFRDIGQGSKIENIVLAGAATGTLTVNPTKYLLQDVGLLTGTTLNAPNGTANTIIQNITNNATINITVDAQSTKTAYIATIVGRATSTQEDLTRVKLINCINNGDFSVQSTNPASNFSRLGGLIGHAASGIWFVDCANYGDLTVTGAVIELGDLCASAGPGYVQSFVSGGSITNAAFAANILGGMRFKENDGGGNVIAVTVTGKSGDTLLNTLTNESYRFLSDGAKTFLLPVRFDGDTKVNAAFAFPYYFTVNGNARLYWYSPEGKALDVTLDTKDAIEIIIPFATDETAIPLSTAAHLLLMQTAINEGTEASIRELYTLGGADINGVNMVMARSILRTAHYKLQSDIVLDDDSFLGIGTLSNPFSGYFNGNGHTITFTLNHSIEKLTGNVSYGIFGNISGGGADQTTVENLVVDVSINLSANLAGFTLSIGGLAGEARKVIINNVLVKVNQFEIATTGKGAVNAGGAVGIEGGLLGGARTAEIACTMNVTGESTCEVNIGGFSGLGISGGNVIFTGGTGIYSGNADNSKAGGSIGYSWSPNDLRGITVENRTSAPITIHAKEYSGGLLGYHTTQSALPDVIALQADASTQLKGAFIIGDTAQAIHAGGFLGGIASTGTVNLSGLTSAASVVSIRHLGGLIGYLSSGTASITDCCNYGTLTGTNPGGLIGYNTGTVTFQNAAYLKTGTIKNAVYNVPTDPTGVIALDTTALPGASPTFGGAVQFLTAAPPAQLTFAPADSVSVDGTGKLTFTKAGDVVVSAKWNGTEIYNSGTITVAQKDIGASATILDVLSAYPHTGSAVTPVPTVKDGDTELTLGTDYTLGYSANTNVGQSAKVIVNFTGNYTGSKEATFEIAANALAVTSADYTGVYDGQEHKITVTAPEGATISYCNTVGGNYDTHPSLKDAGTTTVYFKVSKDNCTTVTGSQIVTITPAPLTITAKSYYIYVGGTAPTTYEYTVTGLVGDEKLTAEPSRTCTPDVLKVGTYSITLAGAAVTTPANYAISYVPGSLNVMYYIDEPRTAVSSGSEIYTGDLQRLAAQNKDFTVTGDNGSALKFNPEALKELAKNGGKITVTISDAVDRLSEAQKKIAGNRPVFDLTVMSGKTVISDFGGGSVQVSLPYTLKDGEDPDLVCVWNLAEDGTLTRVSGRYDPISKTIVFTTAHFSQYVVGKWVNHFADVAESAWYYGSVAKMNALGLMNGTDAKTFSASTKATRSMLLSMLYRMAGSPEAIPASGAWYGRALSWALGSGISDGTNPERDISREELVTILWRYAGSPKTGGNISRFADAASVAGYAKDAMAWAVESGLLIGSEGKLLPKGSAYRAQVAAVLSRYIDTLAK